MKFVIKTLLLICLSLGIGSVVSAKNYKMAVTDIEGMDALISEWGPFKEALEKATGDTFEFFAVSNQTATAEALRGKKLDFVFL